MEEDIEIIKKHYVFTTNHVLDDENKRFKQAIETLINKYKEQKRDIQASHILLAKYSQKNEEQEKIIELMSEKLAMLNLNEMCVEGNLVICSKYWDCNKSNNKKLCIIDYFKKKARDENGI